VLGESAEERRVTGSQCRSRRGMVGSSAHRIGSAQRVTP
jgi:hypothetical protein